MKNLEQKIFERIAYLTYTKNKSSEVVELLKGIKNMDDLDLMTICKLEVLFSEPIIKIPTKQEWRKIKLEQLNEIFNEKD